MATETPYISRNPGDLIAASDWNNVQSEIKEDIGKRIKEAIKNLTTVPNSENTHKIDNQTADELTRAILEKAKQELPLRTGYLRVFRSIKLNEEIVIKHNLGAYPNVDIYQLDEFSVICSEDDEKSKNDKTLFYLYHTSEKRLRATISSTVQSVDIEPSGRTPFRIPFSEMLSLYRVSYTDTSSLGDLETEFWDAFLKDQNDEFNDDQYCHSPWFDRCCGEKRTVADLKQRGDWDELWFKVMPRKTIPFTNPIPLSLHVLQFSLNTLGIGYKRIDEITRMSLLPVKLNNAEAAPALALPAELPLLIIMKV